MKLSQVPRALKYILWDTRAQRDHFGRGISAADEPDGYADLLGLLFDGSHRGVDGYVHIENVKRQSMVLALQTATRPSRRTGAGRFRTA